VLRYPRGKVLGGSSSINGMIYMRGQSRDYDGWATQLGDEAWRWDACLPFFKQHEDHWRGADALHGAGNEWRIEKPRLSWPLLDAFALAAQQAGIAATDDFNRGNNEGVGYFEVNQKRGLRWNASKAFLRPVQRRRNLEVRTGAMVTRLVLERGGDGRRRDRHAAAAAALGHRAGAAAAAARHRGATRAARRRRKPARPFAAPRGVRRVEREHAQSDRRLLVGQGAHRAAIRADATRADEHGAVAARRLCALVARARLAESAAPRAAAVARRVRRAAASLPGALPRNRRWPRTRRKS
jgi:GMC oxidoreductase